MLHVARSARTQVDQNKEKRDVALAFVLTMQLSRLEQHFGHEVRVCKIISKLKARRAFSCGSPMAYTLKPWQAKEAKTSEAKAAQLPVTCSHRNA